MESARFGKELFEEVSEKKSFFRSTDELVNKVIKLIHSGANIEYKEEKTKWIQRPFTVINFTWGRC